MFSKIYPRLRHYFQYALSAACSLVLTTATLFGGDAELSKAISALQAKDDALTATVDDRLSIVRHLASTKRFLQPSPAGVTNAQDAVANYLHNNAKLFGGDELLLQTGTIVRDTTSSHSGLHTIVWHQQLFGIPVHRGLLIANLSAGHDLLSIGSGFLPTDIAANVTDTSATVLSAADALSAALGNNGDSVQTTPDTGTERKHKRTHPAANGDVTSHLMWFVKDAKDVRLAWSLVGIDRADDIMYQWIIDAHTLALLDQIRLTSYGLYNPDRAKELFNADVIKTANTQLPALSPRPSKTNDPVIAQAATTIRLRVYTDESPRPLSPGWPTNTGSTPPEVPRELLELASLDATASPDGWVDGALQTKGNNVDAHLDLDNNNVPDTPRPQGTGTPTTFDFPLNLANAPSTYRDAAVTNLFYWCNFSHDRFYQLGFTESAGNFQNDNFGRGGSGGDAVNADAQDGGGTNNANMSTPPDGSAPRMQMYVWGPPFPVGDGDLDASVIIHEYTHGVSNRLVGGGGGLTATQSRGMGEGWSDFFSLTLLSSPNDDLYGTYTTGGYVTGNWYNGIRRYPYCIEPNPIVTPSSKNPLTYSDIINNPQVHDEGEVWCITLWECRAELINRHGASAGNTMIMQLVMDGMKLTPAAPTMVQARDGILQADLNANAGANQEILWRAFAKRGLGRGTYGGANGNDTTGVKESFDTSEHLVISELPNLLVSGEPGGPFSLSPSTFKLTNIGTASLNFAVADQRGWLAFSTAAGSLAAGATTTITVTLTTAGQALAEGDYSEFIIITDTTNNGIRLRKADFSIQANYTKSTETYAWVDPTSHTKLTLGDDQTSSQISIPFTFPYYGSNYSTLRIDSNGLIKVGTQSNSSSYLNANMPNTGAPNTIIAPWWDDLNAGNVNGRVRYGTEGTAPNRRFVITWFAIPHYSDSTNSNPFTFQAILEETTGDIVFQYNEVQTTYPTLGRGRSATIGIENNSGLVARLHSYNGSTLLSNSTAFRFHKTTTTPPSNAAPTVAAGITPTTAVVGNSVAVTVLGADDGGEANLTYNWSVGGISTDIAIFSVNGTNAAKGTTITFKDSGVFPIHVTISDAFGKSVVATANISVNRLPEIDSVSATPSPVTTTSTTVSASAHDDDGETALTYTWSTVTSPVPTVGAPAFPAAFSPNGNNATKSSTATFTMAGDYVLRVTVDDGKGGTAMEELNVTVVQTVNGLTLTPANPTVALSANQQFTATFTDQFGTIMNAPTPTVNTWSIDPVDAGSIDGTGMYTAPDAATTVTVTAETSTFTANTTVTVGDGGGSSSGGGGGGGGGGCGFGAGLGALFTLLLLALRVFALRRI